MSTRSSPTPEELREWLDVAVDAAWRAGRVTLAYFQTGLRPETKADGSPVTVADREAERFLRTHLAARFPGHSIVGEEMGADEKPSPYRWWIDPIDGTQSFVHGVPLYGVLLGLEVDGTPTVGVAHFPALDETYAAAPGTGCLWNGRRSHVSTVESLAGALVAYTHPRPTTSDAAVAGWSRVCRAAKAARGWSDCYGHCLVATGRADVMLDLAMNPWDSAALVPLLREAGGTFTDWRGRDTIHGGNAVSTNGVLLDSVLKALDATA